MTIKPTYEELEKRVRELEGASKTKDTLPGMDKIQVSGINIEWNTKIGTCSFENLPVAMMWVDTTLAGLMSGVQAMVGTERFGLALQSEGRKSVEEDWKVISQFPDFMEGFKAIANIAAVAGWGDWRLISYDEEKKECRFRIKESWEGVYQKALGVCWGSGMLAGKLGGYCSKLFQTNCWSEQIRFIAKGYEFDEFVVRPSERSLEKEIENLLVSDEATRADMAVALEKLRKEVSERKQAEKALRESEEKYRILIDNANDAIFIAQDGIIKFPNPRAQEITGYTMEEMSHIRFTDFIHPEDRDMVLDRHRKRLAGEEPPSTYSFRIVNRSGEDLWVQINTILINWEGRPATLNFLRDVTEQRKLEKRLLNAQKMESIGTLAGGIAHDFNNILSPIIGNTELAMMDIDNDNRIQLNLKEILKAAHRARELVQQILTFSRQRPQRQMPVQMSIVIKEVSRMLRSTVPTTIDIRTNIKTEFDTVFADPSQIHQVIMNLCTNASHAMLEKGGVLDIELDDINLESNAINKFANLPSGAYLTLTIRDTGHGIKPEVIEKIFEPYFTTKEIGGGTGLGLAVVHGIVQDLGGYISVESVPGEGSSFQVIFPKYEGDVLEEKEDQGPLASGTERILLVDDEKSSIDVVKVMLERLGYKVTSRTSSIEALKAFRNQPDNFDLVITDMTMPNITGKDLAKNLMTIRPDIPIILCTGFSEQVDEKRAKEIGVSAFVMKPIVMRDIACTIREVLDKKD